MSYGTVVHLVPRFHVLLSCGLGNSYNHKTQSVLGTKQSGFKDISEKAADLAFSS